MTENPATCTLDALATSLRDLARDLVAAGCTVHVNQPSWKHGRPVSYFYVTKADLPGVVIVSEADFPRLGEPPMLSIPVGPHSVYGSAVQADPLSGEEHTDAVLRLLESGTVTPRFVQWDKPPVPVDRRRVDSGELLVLTLEADAE